MTNPLSALPPELFHEILVAAVVARGVRRATRLRYVSRTWDTAVVHAIFASRILDGESNIGTYWVRYLAFQTMGRPVGLPRQLRIIRQVAERLAAHRSSDDDHHIFTDAALRDCVLEICAITEPQFFSQNLHHCDLRRGDAERDDAAQVIDSDDAQYRQCLLAAASWANEVALVRELLPSFRGCEELICLNGHAIYYEKAYARFHFKPIFGHPLGLAAFRGHEEVFRLLMDAIPAQRPRILREEILRVAALGNQMAILNVVLEPEYPRMLVSGLQGTTSVEIFKKLLLLAMDHLQNERRIVPNYFHERFLPRRLAEAAKIGNIAMMEHLAELGAVHSPRHVHRDPVYRAASQGRKEALEFLLGRGFPMTIDAFMAAVRYGDVQTVEVALGQVGETEEELCRQLILFRARVGELHDVALEKENEAVYRLLSSRGGEFAV